MTSIKWTNGIGAALFAAVLPVLSSGADWPRFRGPNGTGIATDKDVPVRWMGREAILWKWACPGTGNSSPVIVGGKVFLQSATNDGSERHLHCIDAANGKLLWARGAPGDKAHIHARNSLASCTPASDGRWVYVVFWDGKELALCAYDFAGTLHWKRDLGPFKSQHGPGHSPIVHDGVVYLANDQDGSANLLAFDAKTGKDAWHVQRKAYRACYSTPFLRTTAGNNVELLVVSTSGAAGYEPKTGKENWSFDWSFAGKPLRTVASSILSDDHLVVLSGDGDGSRQCMVFDLNADKDPRKSKPVWQERKSLPYVPCPLAKDRYLYTVNDRGIAACHVLKTGEEVWTARLGSSMTASPIVVDGKIYAVGEDGKVYVFEAAPEFKLLGTSPLGENVMATPAVADNRLYVRGKDHLFCIGKK